MKIQEYLEEAVQDIFEARTYISTNSIPVVRFRDFTTDREGLNVVIHCPDVNRLQPNYNFFECTLNSSAVVHREADPTGADVDALVDDMQDEIFQTLSTVTLQAAIDAIDATSGITVDGIVNIDSSESGDDDFNVTVGTTNIYLTYVKP